MADTKQKATQEPPQLPDFKRSFRLYPYQWIGLPLLVLLPVLAVFGAFGGTTETVTNEGSGVTMEVEYPPRTRYEVLAKVDVSVTNTSDSPMQTLTVSFERDYVDAFSDTVFLPTITRVTDTTFEIDLDDVQPGETRSIDVEMNGAKAGMFTGSIHASAGDAASAQVLVSTMIFP